MVHLAYLGKEYGIAKLLTIIIGGIAVGLGFHSFFSSGWFKDGFYTVCAEIEMLREEPGMDLTAPVFTAKCPNIGLEEYSVGVASFALVCSVLGLLGHIFSKQLAQGTLKIADTAYHVASGVLVIVGGSLFLYSTLLIETLFEAIKESEDCQPIQDIIGNHSYQMYDLKMAAGSLSIVNGAAYFGVAAFQLIR